MVVRGVNQHVGRSGNGRLLLHALAHGIDQRRIQAEHVKPDNRYFSVLAVAEYHGGSVEIMQDALDPQVRSTRQRLEGAPQRRCDRHLSPHRPLVP